ncbi:hypothetical protein [Brachybacterium sp. NPDC056505]|uniref:hypothetical protein n=1 Tax=Brachybacterium sp. NPDC056505 TaxID=3345843 RepID=UPI003670ECBF
MRTPTPRIAARIEELEWLLDGGVWPPTACARVGWTVETARTMANRYGLRALAHRLGAFDPLSPQYAEHYLQGVAA